MKSKSLYILVALLLPLSVSALDTRVTLQADDTIQPGKSELITFGLPLAAGEVSDLSQIKVVLSDRELAVAVKPGLRWHWKDNSLRSVVVQIDNIDMTGGNASLRITNARRDVSKDLSFQRIQNGWVAAGADKANLSHPRIYALHTPSYLASTGLVPPYNPGTTSDPVGSLQTRQFDVWAGGLDYAASTKGNWLFDRSSAMFKAYMGTGEAKFLKEAILSKQFYFQHVQQTGQAPSSSGGDGCFTYGGVHCGDGKYIAPQQAKLAWALVGDDTQWSPELINNMALQADAGGRQYPTRDLYDVETEGFTERGAGIAGLAEVAAYEITGDATILKHLQERIAALEDMQQTIKPWDRENGWIPKSGAFTHSWAVHENSKKQATADLGVSDDRRFSPWMSENVADFLWQAFVITGDERVPEMLRLLGSAIELHGFVSTYVSGSGINARYQRKSGIAELQGYAPACGGHDPVAVEMFYSASAYASTETMSNDLKRYTDNHNPEVILPLALAYAVETDPSARQRLAARIEKLYQQWTDTSSKATGKDCSKVYGGAYRLWNWQHRSNSMRTWELIKRTGSIQSFGGDLSAVLDRPRTVPKPPVLLTNATLPIVADTPKTETPVIPAPAPAPAPAPVVPAPAPVATPSPLPVVPVPVVTPEEPLAAPEPAAPPVAIPAPVFPNTGAGMLPRFSEESLSVLGACEAPNSFGVSLADMNNDGWPDIANWSHGRSSHCAWTNQKNNKFQLVADFSQQTDDHFCCGWSVVHYDLDGDGDLDAQGRTSEGHDGFLQNRASNGQVDFRTFVKTPWGDGEYHNYADIDGDGDLEVISSHGVFDLSDRKAISGTGLSNAPHLAIDVDSDGDVDALNLKSATVYLNSGSGKFSRSHADPAISHCMDASASGGGKTAIATILPADYDNDGDIDIACFQEIDDNFRLLINNGAGRFTVLDDATNGTNLKMGGLGVITKAAHVAEDLNNDGFTDVLIGSDFPTNHYLINNGNGTFVQMDDVLATGKNKGHCGYSGRPSIAVNDIDWDGDLDYVQRACDNASNSQVGVMLFENAISDDAGYLQLILDGSRMGGDNTDAIGTFIEVYASGSAQQQRIATKYYHGWVKSIQSYGVAHLGVAGHDSVDLVITWPDGLVETKLGVSTNKRYKVEHGRLGQMQVWTPSGR